MKLDSRGQWSKVPRQTLSLRSPPIDTPTAVLLNAVTGLDRDTQASVVANHTSSSTDQGKPTEDGVFAEGTRVEGVLVPSKPKPPAEDECCMSGTFPSLDPSVLRHVIHFASRLCTLRLRCISVRLGRLSSRLRLGPRTAQGQAHAPSLV